ncbi:heavy metal-binding domain-containing protein [Salmonella enterica]|nr:heavy metal-binding domain-containing protein [Salmonella enterica]ECM5342539.1 heavy metal-binding domain-containing protein [Salmonella enterica subsp. enterica serovar Give]EBD5894702.1 heavy metal-binding domain-containing protein [Salmonella enterica]EBM2050719.1 hypothetical protein [Salmonella enterica]EBQ6431012.1 heavy metal-binding domain-containing protein [Salmonella enterica]
MIAYQLDNAFEIVCLANLGDSLCSFQQPQRWKAKALGADAVVGIDIDYETVGKDGSMLMVSVSGTAVKTRR